MKDLSLNYIDLVLLHQPFNDYYGTWKVLEEFKKARKIKSIGVSNFSRVQVEDLSLFNSIEPVLNQIELNPFYQRNKEVNFYKANNVQVQSWSSFAKKKNEIFTNKVLKEIGDK